MSATAQKERGRHVQEPTPHDQSYNGIVVADESEVKPGEHLRKVLNRPGISPATLEAAGIRHVDAATAKGLCGIDAAGLWIPYPQCFEDGRPYGRLRLDTPSESKKYHQAHGTGVHVYLKPSATAKKSRGKPLAVIEGEFKALALHESGAPAVGVSGFFGYQVKGEILFEFAQVLHDLNPPRILFFGDSDTALNVQFPLAAVRLWELTGIPVFLPRIPLDRPKGIDDCREEIGEDFPAFLSGIISDAIEVEPGMTPGTLAADLLDAERANLESQKTGFPRAKSERRLVEIGSAFIESEPIAFDRIQEAAEVFGIARRTFSSACKTARKKQAREAVDLSGVVEGFFFDGRRYYRERAGEFETLGREDILLHLEARGAPRKRFEGEAMSKAEQCLFEVQNEHRCDYAGPVCGRNAGLHREGGHSVLVTRSPKIIEATGTGEPGPLWRLFAGLFGEGRDADADLQLGLFFGWLKQFRRALRDTGTHLPGHLLGLIGERDCGKSLAQDIITLLAGGRSADAASWLQGRTNFNSQLWGAEHLILSDSNLEEDPRVKKAFRDAVKGLVANPVYPLARKYADELSLRPIWRISLSANDDPQSAGVIPNPIADPSLADKVLYLRCYPPPEPFHGDEPNDRLRFWESLVADIPNFLGLVENFEVEQNWQKGRFGVREWVHPELVNLLDSTNPDREFIEFLDDYLEEHPEGFEGRAKDLFERLDSHSDGRIKRCVRNSTVLSHAMKRVASLPDWSKRIEYKQARFGPKRKPALQFFVK